MVHFITYELVGPRMPGEAHKVAAAIKALGNCYAFHGSAWVLESELTNEAIGERLRLLLRPADRLLVTRIHRDWVGANMPPAEADWLGARNFTSLSDPSPIVRPMQMVRS